MEDAMVLRLSVDVDRGPATGGGIWWDAGGCDAGYIYFLAIEREKYQFLRTHAEFQTPRHLRVDDGYPQHYPTL